MRDNLHSVCKPSTMSECLVIAFPLQRRVGKIRRVAQQVVAKRSERHEAYYRDQISEALAKQLKRLGVSPDEGNQQIGAFWQAVEIEVARCNRCDTPGGSAA